MQPSQATISGRILVGRRISACSWSPVSLWRVFRSNDQSDLYDLFDLVIQCFNIKTHRGVVKKPPAAGKKNRPASQSLAWHFAGRIDPTTWRTAAATQRPLLVKDLRRLRHKSSA